MKKFISLLLVATMICSAMLLPSAAEENAEQQPIATETLIQEEPTIQPTAIGDQTTYHICCLNDGGMLSSTNVGGEITTADYSYGSIQQQWIFEIYMEPDTYIIRSAANTNLCLTLNENTGVVSLSPFSWQIGQYWNPSVTGDGIRLRTCLGSGAYTGTYLEFGYNSSIGASATTNGTVCAMILPSDLGNVTEMSFPGSTERYAIQYCDTETIYTPTYNATIANAYKSPPWLTFATDDLNICPVNQNGEMFALGHGVAHITVTHKIFKTSATCRVVTSMLPIVELIITGIYFNEPLASSNMPSAFFNYLDNAVTNITEEFGIHMVYSENITSERDLNVRPGCAMAAPGYYSTSPCSDACGAWEQCNALSSAVHHKSASRTLRVNPSEFGFITIRAVDYMMCGIKGETNCTGEGTGHTAAVGVADNKELTVSTAGMDDMENKLTHELSHILGASHDDCEGGTSCVLAKGAVDEWCDTCKEHINENN